MKLVKICDMLPVKKLRILTNTNIFVMTNIFKYFIFIYILYIFFIKMNVGNIYTIIPPPAFNVLVNMQFDKLFTKSGPKSETNDDWK